MIRINLRDYFRPKPVEPEYEFAGFVNQPAICYWPDDRYWFAYLYEQDESGAVSGGLISSVLGAMKGDVNPDGWQEEINQIIATVGIQWKRDSGWRKVHHRTADREWDEWHRPLAWPGTP